MRKTWLGILVVLLLAIPAVGVLAAASVTSDSPLATAGVGKVEVSIGDMVADAIRSAVGADMAFISASELKDRDTQIPRGKVATADVTPYIVYGDDPVVTVQLTGKQVKQALERSVLIYPQRNLGFLQVSGLKFAFDPSRAAENRVIMLRVPDGERPIADTDTFSVAMTTSMANGALGYWKVWSKQDIRLPAHGTTIPQAIETFFSTRTKINYSGLNRITVGG